MAAARSANECRRHGVRGSPVDFLICAVALANDWKVFTTGRDFARYAEHAPLRLYDRA